MNLPKAICVLMLLNFGLGLNAAWAQPNKRQPTLTVLFPTHDTASVNITTSAYVEVASTSETTKRCVQILFDNGTDSAMIIAIGAAGAEVDKYRVPSSGLANMDVHIPAGKRVSLKAIGSNATTGIITIDCYHY